MICTKVVCWIVLYFYGTMIVVFETFAYGFLAEPTVFSISTSQDLRAPCRVSSSALWLSDQISDMLTFHVNFM